jgi:thymidine kinase
LFNFPARVQITSATTIDNIFVDVSQFKSYIITPIINGVSDHDAQLLTISTADPHFPIHKFKTVRKINKYTISDFIDKLSCESWDIIFNSEDVNEMLILF